MKLQLIKELLLSLSILGMSCTALASDNDDGEYYNMLLDEDEFSSVDIDYNSYIHRDPNLHFQDNSTIKDVLEYPLFKDFARFLVPSLDKDALGVTLDNLQKLMPYHRNISIENTLEVLDHLESDIKAGKQVFYPIYDELQQKENPELQDTGFFFIRGKLRAPYAVVVSGGYDYRSVLHEGFPLALRLSHCGYNVFVLVYRQKSAQKGSLDLMNALNQIDWHARQFGVQKENYSMWGASSGAQVIIAVTHGAENAIRQGKLTTRSVANIFEYPISFYASYADAPTYVVVGQNDKIINSTVLKSSVANLQKLELDAKYIELPRLSHGFGLGEKREKEDWVQDAINFWKQNMVE